MAHLACIFLMANEFKHLFLSLLAICHKLVFNSFGFIIELFDSMLTCSTSLFIFIITFYISNIRYTTCKFFLSFLRSPFHSIECGSLKQTF